MCARLIQRLGHLDAGILRRERQPPAEASPRLGGSQSGPGPFLDQAPLELCQGRENIEHQLTRRGCCMSVINGVMTADLEA